MEHATFEPVPDRARAESGTVYLIGAGPGDPDLLTVRARYLIETADVILHDALVRETLVDCLPSSATVLDVGKRVDHKTPQEQINRLMEAHADDGDAVVRLKGGDPFVFGRGGEEAQYLAKRRIPFEIVPGISSATAAPGIAGIPLTHRKVSSRFTVITGHETPEKEESTLEWDALARHVGGGGTLVILMGVRTLDRNVRALQDNGLDGDTPVAVIQKASWETQHVVRASLESVVDRVEESEIGSPATVVIGDVIEVYDDIDRYLKEFEPA
ncbi:Uroporphyrinogen-III methylase [Halalkaliarchaeum sp. AArc-CO]|uniref:uroporphyrinogen-III C-methyltransferase n=1 Tax=Halalkaliarchaeum sp. AArc-CO TaxID=2866381 RepID=UPI00217D26F4|nr:uroporphyrinogen-III C-methyltransferase [Halalkaliarchaeum sp. AArc-CO]UWG52125.1 Uroporphyrinogen-III methylase [Halalkaliarchaeum sp. AArc-CO]